MSGGWGEWGWMPLTSCLRSTVKAQAGFTLVPPSFTRSLLLLPCGYVGCFPVTEFMNVRESEREGMDTRNQLGKE